MLGGEGAVSAPVHLNNVGVGEQETRSSTPALGKHVLAQEHYCSNNNSIFVR